MTQTAHYVRKNSGILWLIGILAFSTILRLAFIHEPLNRDEGQYAAIAQNILHGGLPYRDAIEIKPPGAFYLYALAIGLFGATTEAIRLFTALYALLTVIAVYGVARHISGNRAGLFAALVYGVCSTFPQIEGSSSNTEVFLVLPLTAGMWFLLKALETRKRAYLCWCGVCAGLAMLVKPVALPVVVLEFLLIASVGFGKERWRKVAADLAAYIMPAIVCAGATLGYFHLRGGLSDFLYWTVDFPRNYKASAIEGPPVGFILSLIASSLEFPVICGIPAAVWIAMKKRNVASALPLLMILAAAVAITLPGKYFQHYFITIVPFLAISAGIGIASIPEMPRAGAGLAILVACVAAWFAVTPNIGFYTSDSPETVSFKKYDERTFAQSVRVAQYLREHTRQNDYIFQWGMEPELYFLADRRCPNPYLVSLLPGWSKDPQQAVNRLVESLVRNKPRYIVIQPSWSDFAGARELAEIIRKGYREETRVEYALIFRYTGPE